MNIRHLLVALASGATLAGLVACSAGTSTAEADYLAYLEREIGPATVSSSATPSEWVDMGRAVCTSDRPTTELISVIDGVRGLNAWNASVAVAGAQVYLCGDEAT